MTASTQTLNLPRLLNEKEEYFGGEDTSRTYRVKQLMIMEHFIDTGMQRLVKEKFAPYSFE